uniref:Uncharacterized protein n=1 Tax=viral metagenome TaxID=1070528 RepID=A0A6C0HDV0_9ZZZZ
MSFEQLLNVARNNIMKCLIIPPENFDIKNRYTCNPTNFEPHMLHPWSEPFIGQIYFLNYYVFTTASINHPWNRGGLWPNNGMNILFYIRNEHLKPLEEFCAKNKLLVSKVDYEELDQIGLNVNIDFTPLSKVSTHIEVYDPDENCHTLFLKLYNFFEDFTKDNLYSKEEDMDFWFFKNNFYEKLEREILNDTNIKYNMVLLNNLKNYVKVFYHPIYINGSAFRLGVSKNVLEKLKTMSTHKIHILDWKPSEKCDYHINLIQDWEKNGYKEYTSIEVLSNLLKILM